MESSVEFVCCDNPPRNPAFTSHAGRVCGTRARDDFGVHEKPRLPLRRPEVSSLAIPGWRKPATGQSFTPCPPLKPPQHPARRWPCMVRQQRKESAGEHFLTPQASRSEERRVGKEGRA